MKEEKYNILECETVELLEEERAIRIIDQTLLPGTIRLIDLRTAQEIYEAIYLLKVRGAPAIGVTAAFGMWLLTVQALPPEEEDIPERHGENIRQLGKVYREQSAYLESSRPTAVNLSWALRRMGRVFETGAAEESLTMRSLCDRLLAEARSIRDEDVEVCRRIGEYGLSLLRPGDGVLTHCNAGQLATIRYGTATAPMYLAQEKGYGLRIYADETRPLLQGARLTAFELSSAGMDVTLLCDNMSASLMRSGAIQAVFVGCDRVAANGDAANKIGTSMAALAAARYHIPFYVCAPTSTIDMSLADGSRIVIEQRPAEEVTEMWYKERMTAENVKVYNPAFDVTDHDLITGIITEHGIAYPPYTESLREVGPRRKPSPV